MQPVNKNCGFCKKCQKWVLRDDMLSINAVMYTKQNTKERIRIRACPECREEIAEYLRELNWTGEIKPAIEVQMDSKLAKNSDFKYDDSEEAMRKAGLIKEEDHGAV